MKEGVGMSIKNCQTFQGLYPHHGFSLFHQMKTSCDLFSFILVVNVCLKTDKGFLKCWFGLIHSVDML
jgi:hypothetical protein